MTKGRGKKKRNSKRVKTERTWEMERDGGDERRLTKVRKNKKTDKQNIR